MTYLGEDLIGGVTALKYSYKKGDFYWVWISSQSNLPLRAVSGHEEDLAKADVQATLSAFQWDVAVDDADFTLELPANCQWAGPAARPAKPAVNGAEERE